MGRVVVREALGRPRLAALQLALPLPPLPLPAVAGGLLPHLPRLRLHRARPLVTSARVAARTLICLPLSDLGCADYLPEPSPIRSAPYGNSMTVQSGRLEEVGRPHLTFTNVTL